MTVAAIVIPGNARQRAHLPGIQGAVGDGHTQHVCVFLHVQAVLQAQRQKLFFAQLARTEALDLVAKLRNALEHQRPVIVVVLIHVATSSGCSDTCAQPPVGASLLAMVVNDDAGGLIPRGVFRSIASRLAPTEIDTRLVFCRSTMHAALTALQLQLNIYKPDQNTPDHRWRGALSDPYK
ncbi:hypothetical protein D3C73_1010260 [compost metagenome]